MLPFHDKLRFENAVRDLTVYAKREQGQYEQHTQARKVLRVILGPAPEDPEYRRWWVGRLTSVRMMRDEGTTPEFTVAPPAPLPGEEPQPPKKQPARKRVAKG